MNSRAKGVEGEREVAAVYARAGLAVRGLEGTGDHLVIGGLRPLHSECKRQERLQVPIWLRQARAEAPAGTVPVVAFRQNRGEWWGMVPLADLAELVAHAGSVAEVVAAARAIAAADFDRTHAGLADALEQLDQAGARAAA